MWRWLWHLGAVATYVVLDCNVGVGCAWCGSGGEGKKMGWEK